jgi:hypothetical protein
VKQGIFTLSNNSTNEINYWTKEPQSPKMSDLSPPEIELEPHSPQAIQNQSPVRHRGKGVYPDYLPHGTKRKASETDSRTQSPEPTELPTPPDSSPNGSNGSDGNSGSPEPRIYSCVRLRIYIHPEDYPYRDDVFLPSHWGPTEHAKWDAFKKEKRKQGVGCVDNMVKKSGLWDRKKQGILYFWEYVKEGKGPAEWVLLREQPPAVN